MNKYFVDPLLEENFKIMLGLVYKYKGRVLIELTLNCASCCAFCTRKRKVSSLQKKSLNKVEIDNIIKFLLVRNDITEVVISGGDPFFVPQSLIYLINKLKTIKHLKIIRIHTRLPVVNPELIPISLFKSLKSISKQALYISIHFEHPDEITIKTKKVIKKLLNTGAVLLSQTVFLKNINDDVATLNKLFSGLAEIRVRPYYIYRCDPVIGLEKFIVPFKKEVKIMSQLRKELSGVACPTYVIDSPLGSGKIPVALDFWGETKRCFTDFEGKKIRITGP